MDADAVGTFEKPYLHKGLSVRFTPEQIVDTVAANWDKHCEDIVWQTERLINTERTHGLMSFYRRYPVAGTDEQIVMISQIADADEMTGRIRYETVACTVEEEIAYRYSEENGA